MANPNDPLDRMIYAWLMYAKKHNLSSPELDGKIPEDSDVYDFLREYITQEFGMDTIPDDLNAKIQNILQTHLSNTPPPLSSKESKQYIRIKRLINKLSKPQRQQLYRELSYLKSVK